MSLPKYIPDRADRKKLLKALDEELGSGATPELPPPHLPIYEFLIQLLSIPQDTALCYADALRGNMGINSGEQLLNKKYDEVAPVLVSAGILQGHRKAIKVLLKQQQK